MLYSKEEFQGLLNAWSIVVENEIFVYKSGFIGQGYINKDALAQRGAVAVNYCLRGMVNNAILNGLNFDECIQNVLIIGPAYGAIGYPNVVGEYLHERFPHIQFTTARTELDKEKNHYIPDKLQVLYDEADEFIVVEDIVNQGTTVKEISKLLDKPLYSVICLADRGNNSAIGLNIKSFFPFISIDMTEYDPRIDASLFTKLYKINTVLGKGKIWVEQFGQPPYPRNQDFSGFPLFKD